MMARIAVCYAGATTPPKLHVAWCAAELSYYKVPEDWEVRRGSLPRNAAGKIMKDVLRDARADTGFVEEE
jgi:acyl-CoA synthetase (AMP-forming)/AMP-acid ligase II